MALVRLKGLKRVTRTLASGERVTYWYAWAGGPRLRGAPGSPEFVAGYQEAAGSRKRPHGSDLGSLAARFRASPEFARSAASTQREWRRWLDRIESRDGDAEIGSLPMAALADPSVKAELLEWRDQFAATPRSADYAMQVLSRVLGWSVKRGLIAVNHAEGAEKLYAGDRADTVWSPGQVALYRQRAPSPQVGFIIPLACLTGLRREDLSRLAWANVHDRDIVINTGKSRERKAARIPILPETRALLAEIEALRPADALSVLTNTRGHAWTPSGLTHAVKAVGIGPRLHDARGTFATRCRMAGLTAPQIASIMGWEEARVERILTAYVDRDAVIMDIARTLSGKRTGKRPGPTRAGPG